MLILQLEKISKPLEKHEMDSHFFCLVDLFLEAIFHLQIKYHITTDLQWEI